MAEGAVWEVTSLWDLGVTFQAGPPSGPSVMIEVAVSGPTRDQAPAWNLLDVEGVCLGLLGWLGCEIGRSVYYLESPAVTSTGTQGARKSDPIGSKARLLGVISSPQLTRARSEKNSPLPDPAAMKASLL